MAWVYFHCSLDKNSLFFPFSLNLLFKITFPIIAGVETMCTTSQLEASHESSLAVTKSFATRAPWFNLFYTPMLDYYKQTF